MLVSTPMTSMAHHSDQSDSNMSATSRHDTQWYPATVVSGRAAEEEGENHSWAHEVGGSRPLSLPFHKVWHKHTMRHLEVSPVRAGHGLTIGHPPT